MAGVKTASGYAMARTGPSDGWAWSGGGSSRFTPTYALSVDCFPQEWPERREDSVLGAGGSFRAIPFAWRPARNIQTHAEAMRRSRRLKSQQRAVLQQLMANPIRTVQATLREPGQSRIHSSH